MTWWRSRSEEEDAYRRFSDLVDLPLTVLAIAWLPILVVPLLVSLHGAWDSTFNLIDYLIWGIFLLEYLVKLVLASNRRDFFLHHLLDLVIIVVPVFRPLRLLRVLRSITVLARSASRLRHVLSHHGVHYMLLLAIVSLFSGAGLELYFERHSSGDTMHSYGDVLWWALTTMTTSSGGNFYPVTAAGRGIALVLVLVGLATFGLVTASIASFFVEERAEPTDELTALRSEIADLKVLVRELVDQGHNSKEQLAP